MSRRITAGGGSAAIDNCTRGTCDGHTASCGSSGAVLREPPALIDAADFPQPVSDKTAVEFTRPIVTSIFPFDAEEWAKQARKLRII